LTNGHRIPENVDAGMVALPEVAAQVAREDGRMVVDFPAPFGPRNPTTRPFST
jgi:hypothetical protein